MPLTPVERSLRGQLAAHTSWGNTPDRAARTANARKAFEDRFLAAAGGDAKRAESLRKAYFARLALKSAQARRRKSAVAERITELDGGAA
jgi:hypothetical protein